MRLSDAQLQRLFLDKGFTYRSFELARGCSLGDHGHDVDATCDTPEDHEHRPVKKG